MKTIVRHFRVDRGEICYLKFIFESYENMAMVSTLDSGQGVVAIRIPVGLRDEAEGVIRAIRSEIMMEDYSI